MSTTVIHHSADFDGIFCREIAHKFLPDAEMIGWDYGDPTLEFPKQGAVYVLDLSPDCFWESPLRAENIGRLVWIDHHKSAIDKYDGCGWVHEPAGKDSFGVAYNEFWRNGHEARTTPPTPAIPGYRIDGVAACRLAWQWFNHSLNSTPRRAPDGRALLPTKEEYVCRKLPEPLAIRLVGEYDVWDKRDPHSELFQHGLRSCPLTDGVWDCLLETSCHIQNLVGKLIERGEAVQYAKDQENADIIKAIGFTFKWEGLTWLACNHARYNSHLFTAALKLEHDACFGFKFTGHCAGGKPCEEWSVSLYHAPGKEQHDLSLIAVKHGGGGHRGACGFRTADLPFLK